MSTKSYTTRTGQPISFRVFEQDPMYTKGSDQGYVVHRIEAIVDDRSVGYLKISYIPKKYADKYFYSLWAFLKNHCDYPIQNPDDMDDVFRGLLVGPYGGNRLSTITVPEPKMRNKVLRQYAKSSREATDYNEIMSFLVDRPFVDYIRSEMPQSGVGSALYEFGARWLAETKHLPLYASSIQSQEAISAWKAMRRPEKMLPIFDEPHPTKPDKVRTRLDYRGMIGRITTAYLGRAPSS